MTTWTVRELISDKYKLLGVPHFQRGLVWGKDSVSRLLESLFYNTPCGTFILWKPAKPDREGIKLPGAEQLEYLIIDGQQRIRSIHDALKDSQTESYDETEDPESEVNAYNNGDAAKQNIWCLNLTRISELSNLLDDTIQGYPLFIKVRDPRTSDKKRFQYNLLPLQMLIKGEDDFESIAKLLKPASHKQKGDVLNAINNAQLFKRTQQILDRGFPIIVNVEQDGQNGLSELVQIYSRINSGGVRVESEERAFAVLVSMQYDTNEWLQDLFKEFHPKKAQTEGNNHHLERDDLMQRMKEKNFGFKLFMRTFVQTCNFHFDQGLVSGGFSFDTLNRPKIQKKLKDSDNTEKFKKLFEYSQSILKYVRDILRVDLYCDSFQFLPDTLSLLPVFQLLLKYPQLMNNEAYRPLVRLAILKLMLARPTQLDLLRLISDIRKTNTLEKCAHIIRKIPIPPLQERFENSNSLQDRYVLLLYWLERKHGAYDFSYKNLPSGIPARLKERTGNTSEVPIQADYEPEKQHIVPYSTLGRIFNINGRSRISSHYINNIGNITYISHDLNSFDGGLGDKTFKWEHESDKNLRSHFLKAASRDGCSSSILSIYDEIINEDIYQNGTRQKYTKFCKERAALIAKGFTDWIDEIDQTLPNFERLEPVSPLFAPTKQDKVRELDYDDIVEDGVMRIIDFGATGRELKTAPLALDIKSKKAKNHILIQLRLTSDDIILKFNQINSTIATAIINVLRDGLMELSKLDSNGKKIKLAVRGNGIDTTEKALQVIAEFLQECSNKRETH